LVDRVLLIVESNEALMEFPVGIAVPGIDDSVALWPQDGAQVGLLVLAKGRDERTRFLGGKKGAPGSVRRARAPEAEGAAKIQPSQPFGFP
jgi:hypothetical protein